MGRVVIPGFRKIETSGGGEGGTTNYNDLTNKPSINNVPLVGNLSTVDLKLTDATLTEEGVPAEAKTVGAKLAEQSTSLTALSEQLGNHTVKSDVPENAVFTDTIYDDTEVKGSIDEISSNLDNLSYGGQNGGKNLLYTDEFVGKSVLAENNIGGVAPTGNSITFTMSTTTNDDLSGGNSMLYIIRKDGSNSSPVYPNNTLQLTDADRNNFANYRINFVSGLVGKTIKTCQIENGTKETEYEPYIPSVKMLAEEVNAQNESLSNKTKLSLELGDIRWSDGGNMDSTAWKRSGFVKVTPNTKYTLNRTQTESMNIVGYKEDKAVITDGINPTSGIAQSCKTAEYEFTTTPTTNYIRIAIVDTNLSENITLTNNGIGNTVVELVEDVDSLKNDLGGLLLSASGTTLLITDGTNTWTLEANS